MLIQIDRSRNPDFLVSRGLFLDICTLYALTTVIRSLVKFGYIMDWKYCTCA